MKNLAKKLSPAKIILPIAVAFGSLLSYGTVARIDINNEIRKEHARSEQLENRIESLNNQKRTAYQENLSLEDRTDYASLSQSQRWDYLESKSLESIAPYLEEKERREKGEQFTKNLIETYSLIKGRIEKNQEIKKREEAVKKITKQIEEKSCYVINIKNIYLYINEEIKEQTLPPYIDADFITALTFVESSFKPNRVSNVGARGLMQVMPKTWKSLEKKKDFYTYAFHPKENIKVGVGYIQTVVDYLGKKHPHWDILSDKKKRELVAAAYNCGHGGIENYGWNIKNANSETRKHTIKVLEAYDLFREKY